MNYRILVGKVAADKNSQKLGIIVKIEDMLGKTIKKNKPHAWIRYQKRFKKDVFVPLDLEKLVKAEKGYTWFDITKKEFEEEAERIRKTQIVREIYSGDHKHSGEGSFKASRTHSSYTVMDYTGLSKSKKERKR